MTEGRKRVAVVGGGVAGIVAAWLLDRAYDVVLFERNDYLGGHTHTVVVEEGPDRGTAVDTGFIVFNDRTYPLFGKFLKALGVEARNSNMSFSCQNREAGVLYAGTSLNGLFALRSNLIRPGFHRMLRDIRRFGLAALGDLERVDREGLTLGQYVAEGGYSDAFRDHYLVPMGAAIWSTPAGEILGYPAGNFIRFFDNHGLLRLRDSLVWKTVRGGSHAYVKAFREVFGGQIRLEAGVSSVRREADRVVLETRKGGLESFDQVVIAAHGDQALGMLADPTADEKRLLGPWRYSRNRTVLHTDETVLPPLRRAWASWNYEVEPGSSPGDPVCLTYHMNRLQGLKTREEYSVTLNRRGTMAREKIIRDLVYEHPVYTRESVATQGELPRLGGVCRTWYCGSYFRNGFHEDAVASAVAVAKGLGVTF